MFFDHQHSENQPQTNKLKSKVRKESQLKLHGDKDVDSRLQDIILKIVTSLDMVCLILHSEEIFINTAIFSNWSQKKVTLH